MIHFAIFYDSLSAIQGPTLIGSIHPIVINLQSKNEYVLLVCSRLNSMSYVPPIHYICFIYISYLYIFCLYERIYEVLVNIVARVVVE